MSGQLIWPPISGYYLFPPKIGVFINVPILFYFFLQFSKFHNANMKNIKYIKPVLLANFWAEAANNVIFTLNDVMTSYYDVGSVGVLRTETVTISPTNL